MCWEPWGRGHLSEGHSPGHLLPVISDTALRAPPACHPFYRGAVEGSERLCPSPHITAGTGQSWGLPWLSGGFSPRAALPLVVSVLGADSRPLTSPGLTLGGD